MGTRLAVVETHCEEIRATAGRHRALKVSVFGSVDRLDGKVPRRHEPQPEVGRLPRSRGSTGWTSASPRTPSHDPRLGVIQFRAQAVLAGDVGEQFLAAIDVAGLHLEAGALVLVDPEGHRVRVLPISMGGA